MSADFSYVGISDTIRAFHNSTAFIKYIAGPVGSGKSSACIAELVFRAIRQPPNKDGVRQTRMGLFRQSYPILKTTVMKTAADWLPSDWGTIRETVPIKGVFRFPHPSNDGTIVETEWWFMALRDNLDSLLSMELSCAYLNEATEMNEEVVDRILTRVNRFPSRKNGVMCAEPGAILDFNLVSEKHWIYKRAVLDPSEVTLETGLYNPDGTPETITTRKEYFAQPPAAFCDNVEGVEIRGESPIYRLNPDADNLQNLSREYYSSLLVPNPTPVQWTTAKRMALMIWSDTAHGKLVFENEFDHKVHVAQHNLEPVPNVPIIVGIDTSGFHPCAVFCQQIGPTLYVIDELFGDNISFNTFVSDMLLPFIANRYPGAPVIAVCDPANARGADTGITPIQQLNQSGVRAIPASTNKFELRKESVSRLLTKLNGLIISPVCENIIDGFENSYVYLQLKIKSDAPVYSDQPDKRMNASHYMDALQYASLYVTRLAMNAPKPNREIMNKLHPFPLV